MGTAYRKNPMVRAIDLRTRRNQEGLSTEDMADFMTIANPKQVSAIEIGTCAITLEKAIRAAYRLGGVIVELVGTGFAVVAPLKGYTPTDIPKPNPDLGDLRPGEAAWMLLRETRDVEERINDLQAAISSKDRRQLVELYDELVCDPQTATGVLAIAIERCDPSVRAEAEARHSAHSSYSSSPTKQQPSGPRIFRRQCI